MEHRRDAGQMRAKLPIVGVVGTGAMGLGVVKSLLRNGASVLARDIDPAAEARAVATGARARPSPASLAADCAVVVLLVVDATQVHAVLFGDDGLAASLRAGATVLVCSTVAPGFVAETAARLAVRGITLIDAPVSGGPTRAADGSMTMMLAGDEQALHSCEPVLAAMSARRFVVGTRPGDAATVKVLNNQLAAANLAAGAEAIALAARSGIDPRMLLDVVNASSGASWIVDDRLRRRFAGDSSVHAAMTLLAKDAGIAADHAASLGIDAPVLRAARSTFASALAAGYARLDDGALVDYAIERSAQASTGASTPWK
jgi:3-hydroxyisobutyrate dehydrogenase-like beta-hydroxyacid dehydrogenase